ncbi:MAG TPA: hypothetical protein VE935_14580 [Burkholderiales bacterium]|jgi:hypothetical protein|nr:hypothetical protein [Burkholderiales bacterium]
MARSERRAVRRVRLKVIHRHRIGNQRFRRVSELVFFDEQPKAVLEWVNMAGDRMPLYFDLDPRRLRRMRGARHTYAYDGETTDPRFDELPGAGTTIAP